MLASSPSQALHTRLEVSLVILHHVGLTYRLVKQTISQIPQIGINNLSITLTTRFLYLTEHLFSKMETVLSLLIMSQKHSVAKGCPGTQLLQSS